MEGHPLGTNVTDDGKAEGVALSEVGVIDGIRLGLKLGSSDSVLLVVGELDGCTEGIDDSVLVLLGELDGT